MGTSLLRLARTEIGPRRGNAVLVLILIAVGIFSMIAAYERPFWYDEVITVILCRLPSASAIWKALDNAADGNPPLFYLIVRMGRHIIQDDHLGYRLPSILGLLSAVVCIYAILSRRVDRLSALVGAAFVLCTSLAAYAFEARPYALMVGCISFAILAWQRTDDSKLYSFVLCITLAIALSVHYYAILVWPAFVLAEASLWVSRRRFRASTWIALVLGGTPLVVFAHLLLRVRQYYGHNFWARPGLGQIFSASSDLFNVLQYWGFSFTIGAIAILVCWPSGKTEKTCPSERRASPALAIPIEERILTIVLLLLPLIAVAIAKGGRGGMTTRYMMPTVLGGALAVGYLASKAANAVKALLLVLMLLNYALSSIAVTKHVVRGSLLGKRAAAAREGEEILAKYHQAGLPIVVSSGLQYLPMVFYTPPDKSNRLYFLADPEAAITYTKTDGPDLALLVLRQYFPLQVEDYHDFVLKYREFILVSDGGSYDWWPSRLSHDGNVLTVLSEDGTGRVYRVSLRSQTP